MSSNTHYENAKTFGHEDGGDIEATLALAYEQRTANLIALWSNPEAKSGSVTWGVGEATLGACLQEIQERLDLS